MELNDLSIKSLELAESAHIHFIGIGGSSMSGLAELTLKQGYKVTGSDSQSPDSLLKLEDLGAVVYHGHDASNITSDIVLVVYTVAVGDDNVELVRARKLGLLTVERGIFLGFIAGHFGESVAVSGVHGKTTTTSMLAAILTKSGKNPSVHLGGVIPWAKSNVIAGGNEYFITEACEYHNNFLHVGAKIGILLNLEAEHLDFFGTFENMKASFEKFAENIPADGTLIVCADNENASDAAKKARCKVIKYSVSDKNADYYGEIYEKKETKCVMDGYTFGLYENGKYLTDISLNVPGKHNVSDALAAIAAARELGCDCEGIRLGFDMFHGTGRRFEVIGDINGACVISDYAHHPTEVAATISAARTQTKKKVIAVFQPHTYSRVLLLRDKFPPAFKLADDIVITDIYAAREPYTPEMSGEILSDDLKRAGLNSRYIGPFEDIVKYLNETAREGDIVLILGAGTIDGIRLMVNG